MLCLCVKARKEQRQRLKELEELAGCTFQPNLVSHQLAPAGKALAMSRSMPATQAKAAERHLFDGSGQPLAVERLHEAASLGELSMPSMIQACGQQGHVTELHAPC